MDVSLDYAPNLLTTHLSYWWHACLIDYSPVLLTACPSYWLHPHLIDYLSILLTTRQSYSDYTPILLRLHPILLTTQLSYWLHASLTDYTAVILTTQVHPRLNPTLVSHPTFLSACWLLIACPYLCSLWPCGFLLMYTYNTLLWQNLSFLIRSLFTFSAIVLSIIATTHKIIPLDVFKGPIHGWHLSTVTMSSIFHPQINFVFAAYAQQKMGHVPILDSQYLIYLVVLSLLHVFCEQGIPKIADM